MTLPLVILAVAFAWALAQVLVLAAFRALGRWNSKFPD
jgi:hypothetical protein